MARDQRPIVAPGSKSTDQALALLQMNDKLHRMTGLLDRMAVSATHVIEEWKKLHDIPQQVVHNHFLIDALMGRPPSSGGGSGGGRGGNGLFIPGAGGMGSGNQLPALQHLSTPLLFNQKKAAGPGQQDTRFDQGPNKSSPESFIEKLGRGLDKIADSFISKTNPFFGKKDGSSGSVAALMQLEGARAMMGMGGGDGRGGHGGGGGRSGGRFRYATTNDVAGVVDSPEAGLGGEPFMEKRDTSYIAGGTNLVGELYHNRYTFDDSHDWKEVLSHEHMSKLHAHLSLQARMTPEEQEDILDRLERATTIEDEDPEKTPPPVTSPRKLGGIIVGGSAKAGPTQPGMAGPAPNLKASGLNVWPRPGAPAAPAAPPSTSGGTPAAAPAVVPPPAPQQQAAPVVQAPPSVPTPQGYLPVRTVRPGDAPGAGDPGGVYPIRGLVNPSQGSWETYVEEPGFGGAGGAAEPLVPTSTPPAPEPPPPAVDPSTSGTGKKGRKKRTPKLVDPTKPVTSRAPRKKKPKGSDVLEKQAGVGHVEAGDILEDDVLLETDEEDAGAILPDSVTVKGPGVKSAPESSGEDLADFMTKDVRLRGPDESVDTSDLIGDSVDVPKLTEPGKKKRGPKKTAASQPAVNAPTPAAGLKKQEVDDLIGKLSATKVYRWSKESKKVHASAALDKAKLGNLEGYLSGTKPFNQQAFSRYVEHLKELKNVRHPDDAGIPAVDPDLIKQLEAAGQSVMQPAQSLAPSVEAASGVKPKRGRKRKEDKVVSIDDQGAGPEKATVARNAPVKKQPPVAHQRVQPPGIIQPPPPVSPPPPVASPPSPPSGGSGAAGGGDGSGTPSPKPGSAQKLRSRYHHVFIKELAGEMYKADNLMADNQDMAAQGAAFKRKQGPGAAGSEATRSAHDAERQSRNKFIEALDAFSRKALLGGGVMGSAGAPDAMATLSGSFKLLAAEIGTTLLPSIIQMSRALQTAARWFKGQSESFKGGVGTAATVGIGLAGTYAAAKATGLTSAASWLFAPAAAAAGAAGASALTGSTVNAAAGGAAAGGLKHPYLAAAAVAAAGLTAANVAGHAASSDAERRFSATKGTWLDPIMGGVDRWWFDGINKRTEDALLGADTPTELRGLQKPRDIESTKTYQRYMKKNARTGLEEFDFEGAQADRDKFREKAKTHAENAESYSGQWYNPFRAGRTADQLKYGLEAEEQAKTLETILGYQQDKAAGKELKVPEPGDMIKKKEQDLLKQAAPLLMDFATKTQPGYFSAEDISKKVQLESLGTTPLQEEFRKMDYDTLMKMLEENKSTNRLLGQMIEKLGISKLAKNNSGS